MTPEQVWPVDDVSAASWISEALIELGTVGLLSGVVPTGYDSYVMVPLDESALWAVRDLLAAHTDPASRCWFALWEGWPAPPGWRELPKFLTPEGELLLFTGTFADLETVTVEFACAQYALSGMAGDGGPDGIAARLRDQRAHFPPSLWWPSDRRWVLAREVDTECLHLASDRHVADDLLSAPSLGARRVSIEDPVTIRG